MRTLKVLVKKEWMESVRKHKLLVLVVVFILFGILSPLTAKYLPEIVNILLAPIEDIPNLGIIIPEPTLNDSFLQYYKNLTQMGIFIQILVFMNIVSSEKRNGTCALLLTKSVSRTTFLLSKFLCATFVLVLSLIPSFIVFYVYTYILFEKVIFLTVILGFLLYILLALFVLALTFMASTLTKSTGIAALISIGGYFFINMVSVIPRISKFSPMKLTEGAFGISTGIGSISDYMWNIIISFLVIVLFLLISILSFKHQEL